MLRTNGQRFHNFITIFVLRQNKKKRINNEESKLNATIFYFFYYYYFSAFSHIHTHRTRVKSPVFEYLIDLNVFYVSVSMQFALYMHKCVHWHKHATDINTISTNLNKEKKNITLKIKLNLKLMAWLNIITMSLVTQKNEWMNERDRSDEK